MTRRALTTALAAMTLSAAALLAVTIDARAQDKARAAEVELSALTANPASWDGRRVVLRGELVEEQGRTRRCAKVGSAPSRPKQVAAYKPAFQWGWYLEADGQRLALAKPLTTPTALTGAWGPTGGMKEGDVVVVEGVVSRSTTTAPCTHEPVYQTLYLHVLSATKAP